MAGAPALAGMAALRSGVGLLRIATASVCQATVAAFEPCAMTIALPADDGRIAGAALDQLRDAAHEATAIACGPGLGRSDELTHLVGQLYRKLTVPMVVDADALNALSASPDALANRGGPRVLTPHPGEFGRLIGRAKIPLDEREPLAWEFAQKHDLVLVLKGHQTVITDGRQLALNHTGNPGMATAGAGDVLTGIITALVCQGLAPFDAARLGVYVHGLSGDLAAAERGQVSLVATDLIAFLPPAFQQLANS